MLPEEIQEVTQPNGPGFYKLDGETLLFAPNFVLNKKYELRKENKDKYDYPTDGWSWFDSEAEAKDFNNLSEA